MNDVSTSGPGFASPHDPAASPVVQRPTRVRHVIFVLACFTSGLLYLHRYTGNIVAERLVAEHGFTKAQIGLLGGLFNLAYGVGQIPSGMTSDAFGPHLFLGIVILLWSLVASGQALTTTMGGQGAVRLMFGLTQAGAYPSLNKSTQLWFPPSKRTVVQGWIAAVFGRGGAAASPIVLSTFLIGWCGLTWQQALYTMSGTGVLFSIVFLLLFRSSPSADPRVNDAERAIIEEGRIAPAAGQSRTLPWRTALANRTLRFLLVQQFLSAGADSFFSVFLGNYFMDAWRYDVKKAGIQSLPLLGGALGGFVGAHLNDFAIRRLGDRRRGRQIVGMTGPWMAAAFILTMPFQPNAESAACTLFGLKLFLDWTQPTVWGTCTDVGGRYSATVFGISNTAGTVGGTLCPILFGMILGWSTEGNVTRYGPLFGVLAGIYLIGGFTWWGIDCTRTIETSTSRSA